MNPIDLLLAIVFLAQIGIGLLGNFFLLCLYTLTFLTGHSLRHIDSIWVNLVLANLKVLLPKGLPQTMFYLGLKNFLDPLGCKLIHYLHNVSRSVSLSTTCLLSGFQVITISPSNSRWSELKAQAPKYVVPSCLFCWCFYLLINFTLLGTMHNSRFRNNNTRWWHLGYCSISGPTSFDSSVYLIIFALPDVMCVGVMIWASAYLVFLLHKHHQQVQHIHSLHLSPRTLPEIKATHAIILLVCTYVSFYSIDSILAFCGFYFDKYHSFLMPLGQFMAACFPVISPFILMFYDSQIHKYCYDLWCKKTPQ
ncbi:vomeronasal type-1 receptor 4-like [Trichosurus vulpecula]|uniref:vomeronasal type-1 receptor 4-like n=1 Tax=Trichosurus vulpecula TaxID=9337 RepID=UPI00186B31E0|nr:vomeronasal type-1 receptor 4-like [Trichosurus vulpecula]